MWDRRFDEERLHRLPRIFDGSEVTWRKFLDDIDDAAVEMIAAKADCFATVQSRQQGEATV